MGIFSSLTGGAVKGAVEGFGSVLDNLFTSDEERMQAAERMKQIEQRPMEAQWQINQAEAVSGKSWRHWVGRVAAISLALYFIPQYFMGAVLWGKMSFAAISAGKNVLPPYPVSVDGLMELVTGMLGLGVIKGVEVIAGKRSAR